MTFKTLLRRFETAVRADEMAGCAHPLERGPIRLNYRRHKKAVYAAIKQLAVDNCGGWTTEPVQGPTAEEIEAFNENDHG